MYAWNKHVIFWPLGQQTWQMIRWVVKWCETGLPSSSCGPAGGSFHLELFPGGPGTPEVWAIGIGAFVGNGTGPSCGNLARIGPSRANVSVSARPSADCSLRSCSRTQCTMGNYWLQVGFRSRSEFSEKNGLQKDLQYKKHMRNPNLSSSTRRWGNSKRQKRYKNPDYK